MQLSSISPDSRRREKRRIHRDPMMQVMRRKLQEQPLGDPVLMIMATH